MPAYRTRDFSSRSLEVTTDAPLPPTLSIISPTPRAFTFPIPNPNSDSPFSSPSCSPFEPDLRPLALTSVTPPPSIVRTLSPATSIKSTTPPPTHKRRKSSCSSDVERRPKKGDEDYIKRPENAFILFRRKCCEDRQLAQEEAATSPEGPTKKQRQADLSKTISQQWKGLPAEERQYWEELAKEKKKEHEQMYPNYVYRPQRSKDKDGRTKLKKVKGRRGEYEHEEEADNVSFVLPMHSHRHHGRSQSAPTPPLPYQSIQLPNVYMPSCPTSPSLLPMISRRTSHPGHPMSHFDYCPMPPSFGQAGQFEASLQSSEFFQGMFTMAGQQPRPAERLEISPLEAISMSHAEQMLMGSHQLISPTSTIASGPSEPSSPNAGPYTPATMHNPISRYNSVDYSSHGMCASEPHSQTDAELQAELQLQQELEYSAYAWDNSAIWQSGTEMLLGDDFDLNAIPPIELGVPKFSEDVSESTCDATHYSHEFSHALENSQYRNDSQNLGIFGFDEMMAGHGF